jgi:amidohydrolase
VDPIYAATNIVQSIQGIQTREINALNPVAIIFTEFHAGSNMTIIPEKVEIKGSIRFLQEDGQEIFDRFKRIIKHTCEAHRVEYELKFRLGNNLLSNNASVTEYVRQTAAATLGDRSKVTAKIRTMAGEDFSAYLQHAPGAFAFVGINNPEAQSDYPHHHPKFTIDEAVLAAGVELHTRTAIKLLSV